MSTGCSATSGVATASQAVSILAAPHAHLAPGKFQILHAQRQALHQSRTRAIQELQCAQRLQLRRARHHLFRRQMCEKGDDLRFHELGRVSHAVITDIPDDPAHV